MAKYAFSYDNSGRVVIVDERTNKVDAKLELLAHVELSAAFRTLTQGRKADGKASDAAISMLAEVLQSPILDEYRGKTPAGEKIPSTFASAVRDVENSIFKPAFMKAHTDRGATPGKADALWQEFRKDELNTGSYSNAKSMVAKLFCHVGQRPTVPNTDNLLPLHAIKRMYESWASEQDKSGPATIADKIVALRDAVENRNESTELGNCGAAIAALKQLLATYEGLDREEREAAMAAHVAKTTGDVTPSVPAAYKQVLEKARKGKGKAVESALV